jgi:hypothetical protein
VTLTLQSHLRDLRNQGSDRFAAGLMRSDIPSRGFLGRPEGPAGTNEIERRSVKDDNAFTFESCSRAEGAANDVETTSLLAALDVTKCYCRYRSVDGRNSVTFWSGCA